MSVPRLLVVTAVPYNLARFQYNVSQNVPKNTVIKSSIDNNDSKNQPGLTKTDLKQNVVNDLTTVRINKRKSRMLRNRIASQASREKTRLRKSFLEKQLLELQVQQMKLRLINHDLEVRQATLEVQNALLRKRLDEETYSTESLNEDKKSDTLKHAEEVGSALPVLNSNDFVKRVSKQPSSTYSSEASDVKNFPNHHEQYLPNNSCLSSIAENMHEGSLEDRKESQITDNFDMINLNFEDMDLGENVSNLETNEHENKLENILHIENTSFFVPELLEIQAISKTETTCETPLDILPQWTFDNLFDNLQDDTLETYKLIL